MGKEAEPKPGIGTPQLGCFLFPKMLPYARITRSTEF